jgi:hypothetical protein
MRCESETRNYNPQIMETENMKPKRIQRKRTKGWKMPPNTVYVGRPSIDHREN